MVTTSEYLYPEPFDHLALPQQDGATRMIEGLCVFEEKELGW